jgi:hypothetical protein
MQRFASFALALGVFFVTSVAYGDDKPSGDSKYIELFSFPAKITLDDKQKETLADLVKEYEPKIRDCDRQLAFYGGNDHMKNYRAHLLRAFTISKNAILTDAQRRDLNIKYVTPDCVQAKALNDPKVWDIGQLEKHFTVLSRTYSPEEQLVTLVVITKRKWTESERRTDALNWNTGKVQVLFYNKDEEHITSLFSPSSQPRHALDAYRGITRTEPRLTEQEEKEGLTKFRLKIDLAPGFIGEHYFNNIKKPATVKMLYPEPKE